MVYKNQPKKKSAKFFSISFNKYNVFKQLLKIAYTKPQIKPKNKKIKESQFYHLTKHVKELMEN